MHMEHNDSLEDTQAQTKRMADLTNNLILLSRMEEQPEVQMIEFPISDMAEETVATFQALAVTQEKTLTGIIQPMLSMTGDDKAIRRLMSILLDNAVKYTNEGGTITLTLEKQKSQIRLSVYNTTEHISKKNLDHLFDRSFRTD